MGILAKFYITNMPLIHRFEADVCQVHLAHTLSDAFGPSLNYSTREQKAYRLKEKFPVLM